MIQDIKESGLKERNPVRGSCGIKMVEYMKVNERRVGGLERGNNDTQIALFLMVIGLLTCGLEEERCTTQMGRFTMENGTVESFKVMGK